MDASYIDVSPRAFQRIVSLTARLFVLLWRRSGWAHWAILDGRAHNSLSHSHILCLQSRVTQKKMMLLRLPWSDSSLTSIREGGQILRVHLDRRDPALVSVGLSPTNHPQPILTLPARSICVSPSADGGAKPLPLVRRRPTVQQRRVSQLASINCCFIFSLRWTTTGPPARSVILVETAFSDKGCCSSSYVVLSAGPHGEAN